MPPPLLIVGLGGTTRPGSTSERALAVALDAAAAEGCETRLFGAGAMPAETYDPSLPVRSAIASAMVDALRRADGILIATPSYHGGNTPLTPASYAEPALLQPPTATTTRLPRLRLMCRTARDPPRCARRPPREVGAAPRTTLVCASLPAAGLRKIRNRTLPATCLRKIRNRTLPATCLRKVR